MKFTYTLADMLAHTQRSMYSCTNTLINSNKYNPKFLFSSTNQLVNPSLPAIPASSSSNFFCCEDQCSAVQFSSDCFTLRPIQPSYFTVSICSYLPADPFKHCSSYASLLQWLWYSSHLMSHICPSCLRSQPALYYLLTTLSHPGHTLKLPVFSHVLKNLLSSQPS